MTRIWIDVEDLFRHAVASPRPTGIQRLSFEVQQALVERFGAGGAVRFLRYDPRRSAFAEIPWDDVAALYRGMVAVAPVLRAVQPAAAGPPPAGWLRRALGPVLVRLPLSVREPLARAVGFQKDCVRVLGRAGRLQLSSWHCLAGAVRAMFGRPGTGAEALIVAEAPEAFGGDAATAFPPAAAAAFAAAACPGDILLVLGSPWWQHDHAGLIARTRERYGLRFAVLVYDLILIRHPEWFEREVITVYSSWLDAVLPQADVLLAISRSTAGDLERHAARRGIVLRGPVTPIPVGTGFAAPPDNAAPSPDLPSPGSYVLFVSTIEVRKNHALLFRVWGRLLEELPPGRVPTLVFAGRVGWLVSDLMRQMENANWLDGHVVVIESPSDGDLAALYRGCLFTLFPSLYEGWGLPVTESLAFGKPCVVANATSLPEAGGTFARYFDPDNLHDAIRVIRGVLDDPAGLAAWEADIRRDYRPVPWSASADAVMAALVPAAATR